MTDGSAAALQVCHLCVLMAKVSGGGISLVTTAGNRGIVCATDPVAARIEDLQLTLGEGPCIDVAHSGAPVLVGDLDARGLVVERWPAFLAGAQDVGARAVFAFPMRIGAIAVGVLDLYRSSPGELAAGELAAALLAADAGALAVLELGTALNEFSDSPDAETAYDMAVHQATGMVKVQAGVTVEEAFLLLRARAFAAGRPLAEVAADVVGRRLRFGEEDQ